MIKILWICLLLFLLGCTEGEKMHLSQFGQVNSDMTSLNLEFSSRIIPVYCGNEESAAADSFRNIESLGTEEELYSKLNGVIVINKGLYLYAKISNNILAIASVPHNNFPVNELQLFIRGKFIVDKNAVYIETGIGIEEYQEFIQLISSNVIQTRCSSK